MSGDHQSLIGIIAGTLCCLNAFDCNLYFDKYGGILVWLALMIYMFKALGIICDEYFVPSLEVIVDRLQLSNDVAGATFMAAGSSAPELFTSLVATFLIVNEAGVGTIVGSAIFNILVIVGATGIIACKDQSLKIWWYPLSRDCFFYSLAIVELIIIVHDESVEWYEGLIMILTYVSYCVYMKFNPKIVKMLGLVDPRESEVSTVEENGAAAIQVGEAGSALKVAAEGDKAEGTKQPDVPAGGSVAVTVGQPTTGPTPGAAPGVVAVEEVETAKDGAEAEKPTKSLLAAPEPTANSLEAPKASPREQRRPSWSMAETQKNEEKAARSPSKEALPASEENRPAPLVAPGDEPPPAEEEDPPLTGFAFWARDPMIVCWELIMPAPEKGGGSFLFAASIAFIGLCTYLMVDSTSRVGVILHIPPLAMALVFLAAGTSIPDALGSIAVAKQGEGDMAVANALGSNVFDILIGLGVPWTIKTGILGKEVSFAGKWVELKYDVYVLCFVLFLFIACLLVNKWQLTRKTGIMLIACYFLFLVYNIFAIWVFDPPLKSQSEVAHCDVLRL